MSIDTIKNEQRRIQRLIEILTSSEVASGAGALCLDRRGDRVYCYEVVRRRGKKAIKNYLGTIDSDAARKFCLSRYSHELLDRLTRNKAAFDRLIRECVDCSSAAILAALPKAFSAFPREHYVDERFEEIKAWAREDYPRNSYDFPAAEIRAKDGRRMRSKGECIIYNMLLELGIPFRYDSVLTFADDNGGNKSLSPDFMIQCYDGSHIIIEHLGRMDDLKYAVDLGSKLYWYFHAGFVPGKNLFITSDDLNGGTDSAAISETISHVEKVFWGY